MKFSTVILAAGNSSRSGLKNNKNLLEICGKKLIDYSIDFFHNCIYTDQIILVVSSSDFDIFNQLYSTRVDKVIIGGETRQESVSNSLKHAQNPFVLLHDGARPVISSEFISFIVGNIVKYKAISIGTRPKDTIHIVENSHVCELIDRSKLLAVQTPQCFDLDLLQSVHKLAEKDGFIGTDDLSLVYKYSNIKPFIYILDLPNIKLTTKDDVKLLEVILSENW